MIDYDNFTLACDVRKYEITRDRFNDVVKPAMERNPDLDIRVICTIYENKGIREIERLAGRSSRDVTNSPERPSNKFIFKTIVDALIGSVLSLGVFQTPTFLFDELIEWIGLVTILSFVIILMISYAVVYGSIHSVYGIGIVIAVSLLEVMLIGLVLGYGWDMILVVFLIVTPSVIVFDKLLG